MSAETVRTSRSFVSREAATERYPLLPRSSAGKGDNSIAGLGDKVEGKAKEWQGKLTDDESTEMEGKAQQAVGEVKDAADDVADEVRDRARR